MAEPRYASPLAHRGDRAGPAGLSIAIREIDDRGMIDLRGEPGDAGFRSAVTRVLGVELPLAPRSSAAAGEVAVLWLSVDQWLVTCRRERVEALHGELVRALAGLHALAVDVSDARAVIRLEGEAAREVLMKGGSVDFTLPEYGPGTVRRMVFAGVAAMVHVVAARPDTVDLYVFRSYAEHAWEWLVATARPAATIGLFGRQA